MVAQGPRNTRLKFLASCRPQLTILPCSPRLPVQYRPLGQCKSHCSVQFSSKILHAKVQVWATIAVIRVQNFAGFAGLDDQSHVQALQGATIECKDLGCSVAVPP